MVVLVVAACVSSPRLSPSDEESYRNFSTAITAKNAATAYFNRLGGGSGAPSVGTLDPAELRNAVENLDQAARTARRVSPDFQRRVHPEFPEMWQRAFIPGVEGQRDYYARALASLRQPPSPSLLLEPHQHLERWANWYERNRDAIRDGIRRLAR